MRVEITNTTYNEQGCRSRNLWVISYKNDQKATSNFRLSICQDDRHSVWFGKRYEFKKYMRDDTFKNNSL